MLNMYRIESISNEEWTNSVNIAGILCIDLWLKWTSYKRN